MNPVTPSSEPTDPVAQAAAGWMMRHDRGLTAAEQDEFSQWLAGDPRHSAAWAEHRWGWDELDRLAGLQTSVHAVPDPDLLAKPALSPPNGLAPKRAPAGHHWVWPVLAAAAAVALGVFVARKPATSANSPAEARAARSLALIEQREMSDGTVIELNRGAVVTAHYTPGERRVRLERGEAHFKVAKDAARPFFVEAGGVAVRAVGTAFNVKLDSASVEVLVTEGRVSVAAPAAGGTGPVIPMMGVNERTVVSLAPSAPAPQVTLVPPAEIEARLAWQPRLLDFTDTPLMEIVAEFNRRNPVRLKLGDPFLGEMKLSATFRSDNVEGFVRLMETDFGMKADWRGDEIALSRAR